MIITVSHWLSFSKQLAHTGTHTIITLLLLYMLLLLTLHYQVKQDVHDHISCLVTDRSHPNVTQKHVNNNYYCTYLGQKGSRKTV